MPRLPQPGSDDGTWGDVLNDYLSVTHDADGAIKLNSISEAQLAAPVRTKLNTTSTPGPKGDTGAAGQDGATGSAGPANILTIGTVTAGAAPGATITGTAPSQILNLTLQKGDKGDAGDQGIQGVPGDQGPKGDTGADGAQGLQGLPGTNGTPGLKGDTGDAGQDGVAGPANSLSIGTVTTGLAASATITGAAPAQTLNLILEKGDTGDAGPKGDQGDQGIPGVAGTTTWDDITDKPTSFTPSVHTHTIADVTNLQTALDAKAVAADLSAVAASGAYGDLVGTPAIPAQFVPVAGANMTITGTYPNVTFAATATNAVNSVNTKTGAVVLTQDDVADGSTNKVYSAADKARLADTTGTNTGDQTSVSGNAGTATKLATARTINGVAFDGSANVTIADSTKEPALSAGTTAQYYRGDKSWQTLDQAAVGLSNVSNTSDANKPISTATQAALDAKADTATLGAKVLLINDAADLPVGTPAGVIVVVKG